MIKILQGENLFLKFRNVIFDWLLLKQSRHFQQGFKTSSRIICSWKWTEQLPLRRPTRRYYMLHSKGLGMRWNQAAKGDIALSPYLGAETVFGEDHAQIVSY